MQPRLRSPAADMEPSEITRLSVFASRSRDVGTIREWVVGTLWQRTVARVAPFTLARSPSASFRAARQHVIVRLRTSSPECSRAKTICAPVLIDRPDDSAPSQSPVRYFAL